MMAALWAANLCVTCAAGELAGNDSGLAAAKRQLNALKAKDEQERAGGAKGVPGLSTPGLPGEEAVESRTLRIQSLKEDADRKKKSGNSCSKRWREVRKKPREKKLVAKKAKHGKRIATFKRELDCSPIKMT